MLKAIFATKGIKDQHELIMDAIEEGNPWLVALRIMQMITIIFGIAAQCFTGETLVVTEDGLVAIEDIEVGDYVLAEDTETGEKEYKEVLNVYVSQTNKLVHVTTADDNSETTINTTDNHPFYVEGKGWVPAIELIAGDVLRTADGDVEIVSGVVIEYLDEPVLIYNLEIEGYHTYFVSDESVLVHNTKKCGSNNKDEGGNPNNTSTDNGNKDVDYYVTPEGVALPTNTDYNLVSTTTPTNKGGEYIQIHNNHTHPGVGNPHTHTPQVHTDPVSGLSSSVRVPSTTTAADINYVNQMLQNNILRQRTNRKDKGGF